MKKIAVFCENSSWFLISILFLIIFSLGKEFRAVFISTVRTLHSIDPKQVENLGFLSDPRLLNTAMTRAQSLVAVVGEPLTLCLYGECSHIWEQYLTACNELKGLFGINYKKLAEQMQSSKDYLPKLHRLISETKVKNHQEDVYISEDDESVIPDENAGVESQKKHRKAILRHEKSTSPLTVVDLMMTGGMKATKPPGDQLSAKVENHAVTKLVNIDISEQGGDGAGQTFIESWNDPVEIPKLLENQTKQKLVNREKTTSIAQQDNGATWHVSTELINNSPSKNGNEQGQDKPKPFFEDFASRLGTSISSTIEHHVLASGSLNDHIVETILPSKTELSAEFKSTSSAGGIKQSDQILNSSNAELSQQFLLPPSLEHPESSSVHLMLDQLILSRDEVSLKIYSDPTKFVKCKISSFSSSVSYSVYGEPCEDDKGGLIDIVSIEQPVFNNDIALVEVIDHGPSSARFKCVGKALGIIQPAIPLNQRVFLCWFDKKHNLFVSKTDMHLGFLCHSNHFNDDILETKLFALKLVSSGVCWDSQRNVFIGSVTTVLDKATDLRSSVELYKRIYGIDCKIPDEVAKECRSLFPTPYAFPKEMKLGKQLVNNALSILLPGRFSSDRCFTITKTPFGNYKIGIHVIDMPSILPEDTTIDFYARARCQSLNHTSTVLMPPTSLLPPDLEYDAACLLVGYERPTISVFVTVMQNGDIAGEPVICKSVSVVSDQLLADEINSALVAESATQYSKELISKLSLLADVTQKLRSERQKNNSDGSALGYFGSGMQGRKKGKQQGESKDLAVQIDQELTHAANRMMTELLRMLCPEETPVLKGLSSNTFNIYGNAESHFLFSGNVNTIRKAVQNRKFEVIRCICFNHLDLAGSAAELKMGHTNYFPQYKIGISGGENIDEMAAFTSPSQTYADILIQRLLHKYFLDSTGDDQGRGSKDKITDICDQLNCTMANLEIFKENVRKTEIAYNIIDECSNAYLAVVTTTGPDLFRLAIFTNGNNIFRYEQQHIKFADLGLVQEPCVNISDGTTSLAWNVSLIAPNCGSGSSALGGMVIPINNHKLADLFNAAESEDAGKVLHCWNDVSDVLRRTFGQNSNKKSSDGSNVASNVVVTAELCSGKIFPVWISSQTDLHTGIPILEAQLLQITEEFRLCLQHRRRPEIFLQHLHHFKIATGGQQVNNIEEYKQVWGEITRVNSSIKAVEQNRISILPNIEVSFGLKGKALLSLDLKSFAGKLSDSVAIGDYVCLRVPYLGLVTGTQAKAQFKSEDGQLDCSECSSIWIGHGIVSNVDDNAPVKAIEVKINSSVPHLSRHVQLRGECEILCQTLLQRYVCYSLYFLRLNFLIHEFDIKPIATRCW